MTDDDYWISLCILSIISTNKQTNKSKQTSNLHECIEHKDYISVTFDIWKIKIMPKLAIQQKASSTAQGQFNLYFFICFYSYFCNPLGKLYPFVVTAVNPKTSFVYNDSPSLDPAFWVWDCVSVFVSGWIWTETIFQAKFSDRNVVKSDSVMSNRHQNHTKSLRDIDMSTTRPGRP